MTAELDQHLSSKYQTGDIETFEKWLTPLAEDKKRTISYQRESQEAIARLPIIFHIIHDGPADEAMLSTSLIEAQVEQLNHDFRRTPGTSGFNAHADGADTQIEFYLADLDPFGNPLSEAGINRIDRNTRGWLPPPYLDLDHQGMDVAYVQETIKATTQWDPERYINIWVMALHHKILGFAQSPSTSGLEGLDHDPYAAISATDGIVISYHTVGSTENPNPFPHPKSGFREVNLGRTLTHEMGHFFGLRHIWGDRLPSQSECQTDHCDDTPYQWGPSNPSKACVDTTTCDGLRDMVENYMDYSADACVNIFTQDQKARMLAVLANSPRRNVSLENGPNLVVQNLNIPISAAPGDTVELSFDIVNEGNEDAGEFHYEVAWTLEPLGLGEYPPLDQVLFNGSVEGLEADGVLSIGNVPTIMPNPIVRGGPDVEDQVATSLFIHILVDQPTGNQAEGFGNVIESNEEDNIESSLITLLGANQRQQALDQKLESIQGMMGQSLLIYPNPVRDILHVRQDQSRNQVLSLRLMDIQGKVLLEFDLQPHQNQLEIDLSKLEQGLYFIQANEVDLFQRTMRILKY